MGIGEKRIRNRQKHKGRKETQANAGRHDFCRALKSAVMILLLGYGFSSGGAPAGNALDQPAPATGSKDRPLIVATTTIIYDIAREIGSPEFEVRSLLPIGGDPHIYDPVPADVELLLQADLIIKNGMYLEGWLDKLMAHAGSDAPVITATAGIPPIQSEGYHGSPDPHCWMTATNGIIMAENVKNALANLRPERAGMLRQRFEQYRSRLQELDRYIFERVNTIPGEYRLLITTHDAFRYFANRYGLKVAFVQGISTDAEIQSQDMARLIELIRSSMVPAIFIESTINPKIFRQISKDAGVMIGGELFADSIGDEDSEAATYIDMLRHNTNVLVLGLTGDAYGLFGDATSFRFLLLVGLFFVATLVFVSFRIRRRSSGGVDWGKYQILVDQINVSYVRKTALSNINLLIENGKVYGVLGPNGSGKSSLFKAMLGLIPVDSGRVTLNGAPLDRFSRQVAYIPQKEEIDLNFPATVMDVVLNGRYPHKKIYQRIDRLDMQEAEDAMRQVGMYEQKDRQIGQLSGGQQQRVFLARAICQRAEIYLMDEPFVGVDITTEERMISIIRALALSGKTLLIIHHDLSDVREYFDEVILLNQRLVACGPTDITFNDENIRKAYHGKPTMLTEADTFIYQ